MAVSTVARHRGVDIATVMALTTILVWAGNNTVARWAVGQWQPLAYSWDRFAVGALIYAGYVLWRERSLRIARADLPLLVFAGVAGIAVNQSAFMYTIVHTNATTAALMMATTPGFAALAAWAAGQGRVSGRHWLGIAVAAVGAAMVLIGARQALVLTSVAGAVYALIMSASFGVYSVALRPLTQRYSTARLSAAVLLAGLPPMLLLAWPQVRDQDYGAIQTSGWIAITYALIFSLLVTNHLWYSAIARIGAPRVTALLPLMPFAGALMAYVFLDEPFTILQWAGGAVILLGLRMTRAPETAA